MKRIFSALFVPAILFALVVPSLADTIRLKDGSVIHGQVMGFKDQQFTILVGGGARGRRSSITIYMEDVESIDFEAAPDTSTTSTRNEDSGPPPRSTEPDSRSSRPRPTPTPDVTPNNPEPSNSEPASSVKFFTVKVTLKAENVATGWMNSSLVVRRGQRLRITATGRVSLGRDSNSRWSTPAGLPTLPDKDKLIGTEATGALIGVIGDDNDEFFLVGSRREFVAQRDGALYLGINQGELAVSGGSYDILIEVEPVGNRP